MNVVKLKDWARLGAAAVVALAAGAALAQNETTDRAALLKKQDALFAQMFDAPDDVDLMFQYALTSIALEDYEAAISTLDRMLIYNPELVRARLELGGSYYRIGSYPIARLYFRQVLESDKATEQQKARAQLFLAEIDKRTDPSSFSGVFGFGAIFSTNANSGPDSRDILFDGVLIPGGLTDRDATSQTDIGATATFAVTHKYDLGRVNEDFWQSDAVGYTQRYADTKAGATDVIILRTGPRLSLTEDRYGPKGRPFIEFDHVRSANEPLYTTIGVGFEYSDTIDGQLSMNADARIGWREFDDNSTKDGPHLRSSIGFTYFADEVTTLRGKTFLEWEGADFGGERSTRIGVEGGLSYRYKSGLELANRRPWVANLTARAAYRFFDEPGTSTPNFTRKDVDLRFGIGNTAFLNSGVALSLRAGYQFRDSNIVNFDLDGFTVNAGVLMPF